MHCSVYENGTENERSFIHKKSVFRRFGSSSTVLNLVKDSSVKTRLVLIPITCYPCEKSGKDTCHWVLPLWLKSRGEYA